MFRTDVHPILVAGRVVHAIGAHFAEARYGKIADAHLFRPTLGLPFLARVLEVTHSITTPNDLLYFVLAHYLTNAHVPKWLIF